jgi:hypothetical protein
VSIAHPVDLGFVRDEFSSDLWRQLPALTHVNTAVGFTMNKSMQAPAFNPLSHLKQQIMFPDALSVLKRAVKT